MKSAKICPNCGMTMLYNYITCEYLCQACGFCGFIMTEEKAQEDCYPW